MKLKLLTAVTTAVLSVSLLGATVASAASEFGSTCTANRAEEGTPFTVIQLSQNGVQTVAPASGVVTKWKIRLVPVPISVPQQLKVFRPTADPSQFQVVGESATSNVIAGENVFPTRISIQAGDRLGLFGNSTIGTLFCAENPETENPGNSIGVFPGNPTTGSTATLAGSETKVLVPAAAVIEPDADNDGFGDETQDACPQSATTQVACPVVKLNASATAGKKLVTVLVTGTTAANVTVNGKVSLGKGKKAKLKGGTKAVTPGAFTKFKLKFPAKLVKRLEELPPSKKLTLKVTSSATNVAAAPTKKVINVKLKGQG
ncbi:MAG TPA: hypothetical protein VFN18_11370 [Solirubrobacterales bacterium]|nr:hypothetical protein [Solirubrobacterales bacterium]